MPSVDGANGALCQFLTHAAQQNAELLDHLVDVGEERSGYSETERSRRLQVDVHLITSGLLDRKVGWFDTLNYLGDVGRTLSVHCGQVGTKAYETPCCDRHFECMARRQFVHEGKIGNSIAHEKSKRARNN